VPFSPVGGPRLLARPGDDGDRIRDGLLSALVQAAERLGVSSLHITYPTEAEYDRCGKAGLLQRIGEQFHWFNRGYGDFDDFLASLTSRKRKSIRKERQRAVGGGLTIHALTGGELRSDHWDAFFRFYIDTSDRKWGHAYLNRQFFELIGERMADRIVLFMAEDSGRPVAGALNLVGGDALYGRNWGCAGDYRFLHFETCYYQAIDYAIAHGLARVEAGAQGPHKVHRGYLPVRTYSAHWIRDPGLRQAVANFLEQERRAVDQDIAGLSQFAPFRNSDGD